MEEKMTYEQGNFSPDKEETNAANAVMGATENVAANVSENIVTNASGDMSVPVESKKQIVSRQRKLFSAVALRFFFLSIMMIVFQSIVILVAQATIPEIYAKWTNVIGLLPISIIGFPMGYLLTKNIEVAPKIEQKYEFGVKQFIPFIFIAYAAIVVGSLISTVLNNAIANAVGQSASNGVEQLLSGSDLIQNLIMFVILAPLLEEFLFRKIIIDRLKRYGEGVAILVSALMFGLYHGNFIQFIYATLFGLVLGYVYTKSGKLHFTIIIHMITNFLSGVFGTFVIQKTNAVELSIKITEYASDPEALMAYISSNASNVVIYYAYIMVVYGIAIAGIVLGIITLVKGIKRGDMLLPGVEKLVKGKKAAIVVGNVGAILFMAVWIIMMICNIIIAYFMDAIYAALGM